MSDLISYFFGPLDKRACIYFLIISMLFFVALVLVLGSEIIYLLQNFSKINFRLLSSGLIILFNLFIAYFVNRLLYTMCNKALV
jgi:hypothetical protein